MRLTSFEFRIVAVLTHMNLFLLSVSYSGTNTSGINGDNNQQFYVALVCVCRRVAVSNSRATGPAA